MRSEIGNLRGTLCRQGRYSLMLVATVSDGYTYNLIRHWFAGGANLTRSHAPLVG
jgi:hypothetical protein